MRGISGRFGKAEMITAASFEDINMTQFHEGQEVEIHDAEGPFVRRKATILYPGGNKYIGEWWYVHFPDGTRGCYGAAYIMAVGLEDQIMRLE
jgi:hypothetical protein